MLKKILVVVAMVVFAFGAKIDANFALKTVDNKIIHIHVGQKGIEVKEYPNKVIILDFFGKRCPPCNMMMPILGKVQSKMGKKLQIIGLHVQEPLNIKDIKRVQDKGINYPIVDYTATKLNGEFVTFMGELTGWRGQIPYMLFFDKNGNYAGSHLGLTDEKSLEQFIEKLSKPPKKK